MTSPTMMRTATGFSSRGGGPGGGGIRAPPPGRASVTLAIREAGEDPLSRRLRRYSPEIRNLRGYVHIVLPPLGELPGPDPGLSDYPQSSGATPAPCTGAG